MSDAMSPTQPMKNRRRRKWIRPDLQLKIILLTLFVTTLVLITNFQLSLSGLWLLHKNAVMTVEGVLQQVQTLLLKEFLLSVAIAVPLSVSVGLIYAFKFCGPIYRFKKYFNDLKEGRWDQPCTLRKGDDLQDVNEAINGALDILREKVRAQHQVLQETRAVLAEPSVPFPDRSLVQDLLRRIDAQEADFTRRLGAGKTAGAAAAERDAVEKKSFTPA